MSEQRAPSAIEWALLDQLRAKEAEEARTRGKYVLTAEGRAEVRGIWHSEPDHWIRVLLDEVERLEAGAKRVEELTAENGELRKDAARLHDIEALALKAGFIIETPLRGSAWHPIGPSCKTELLKFAALLLGK